MRAGLVVGCCLASCLLACDGAESRVRVTVNPASAQPSALRVTLYGAGRLVFPSTLALGIKTLPGAVIIRNLDPDTTNPRVLIDGLDGLGNLQSQGAALLPLEAGRETQAVMQLVDGPLGDQDGDGVPDVIDDCPQISDPDQRCATPVDLRASAPVDLSRTGDLTGGAIDLAMPTDGPLAAADLKPVIDLKPALDLPPADLAGYAACPVGALFCDSFESGDTTKWDETVGGGTVTLSVPTGTAYSGTHALRVQSTGGTSTSFLKHRLRCPGAADLGAECPVGSGNTVYLRAFLYTATAYSYPLYMLFAHRDSGNNDYVVGVDAFSGDAWYIFNKNPGNAYKMTGSYAGGAWRCLELEIQIGAGTNVVRLWVDGVSGGQSATLSGTDAAPSIGEIDVGVTYQNVAAANDFYIDDVAVATTRIGCN